MRVKRISPAEAGVRSAATKKAPRPFVTSGPASLVMPSWNQAVGFLTDWERLRRLVA